MGGLTLPPAGNASNTLTMPATYGADLVAGRLVTMANGVASPVVATDATAVTGLLAVVLSTGPKGTQAAVAMLGQVNLPALNFAGPGEVFMGLDGSPVLGWSDKGAGNYVPVGSTGGGSSFFFQPGDRSSWSAP